MNDQEQEQIQTQEGLVADTPPIPAEQQQPDETEVEVPHKVDDSPEDQIEPASEDEVLEKPEFLEDKFWDPKEGVKVEDLNNSYKELQKQFSMGKHKAPKEYDLSVFEGIDVDEDPLAKEFVDWANENKPTQEAFDRLVGKFREMADSQEEAESINIEEETAKLGPNATQIINGIKQWGQGLVSKGVWSTDDFEEFKVFAATASGINALNKVRKYYGELQIPTATVEMDGMPSQDELYEMVADPKYKSDPAFRRQVEQKFAQAFPGSVDTGEI
jgi:hypothetical protein